MPNEILYPVLILGGLGILATVILFIAAKFMHVPVDEREVALRAALPGANCGACGFAGCDDYAKALAAGGVKTNLCVPGGDACAKAVSEILGTEAEDVLEKKAFVRCGGSCENTEKLFRYKGTPPAAPAMRFMRATASVMICAWATATVSQPASLRPSPSRMVSPSSTGSVVPDAACVWRLAPKT